MLTMCSRLSKATFCKFILLFASLSIFITGCAEFSITALVSPGFNGFDSGDEGWRVSEGGIGSFSDNGGNPDGYILGIDSSDGVWYFIASKSFVGETRRSYGRTLSFDLEQSAIDSQVNTHDIVLTDGLNIITFNTSYHPNTTWTHYTVKLDESSGWKKGKVKATKADMQAVLQSLTDLRIRGEYRAGPDQGGLDNVAVY